MRAHAGHRIAPERLERWIARWAAAHAPVERTEVRADRVCFHAESGARLECTPPFPPLPAAAHGERAGFDPEPLLAHVAAPRTVGVLLVRLGGHAAGVFAGRALVASKVDRRLVGGRHRAGGRSQRRFERRRENQARAALADAAAVAARVLVPYATEGTLDAVVLGGHRPALSIVLEDARLAALAGLVAPGVLDVPDPRQEVLARTPELFLATRVQAFGPPR